MHWPSGSVNVLSAGGKELNHEHYEFDSNQQHRNHRGARCSRTGRAPGRGDHPGRGTVGSPYADDPKFKLRDVEVFYGESRAIKKISLDIARNEVIAFIGPSGCGKSTFLRCLNRMNDSIDICSVKGELMLDDQNIYDPKRDVVELRARVGMVFQKPNPFPKSIYDNVAYGPRIHGLANRKSDLDDIVEDSLRKAGLWNEVKDRLDATATGMSGGQQQRLCIARAIAVSPEVILMDEPCSALDPIATAKVEE